MIYAILFYLLLFLFFIGCILLGIFVYDKRLSRNHGLKVPKGFHSTEEINIDPVSGDKTRVYYNPDTGERFYKKEK
ncbi:MAG: hypothetical protein K0R18_1519 [Bacillales bacterium]|jgi:hypothetical protein|nr:hypothetical protein [Bacillales bacterium]